MRAHLTLPGRWQHCDTATCALTIHVEDIPAMVLQATPLDLLLPILNTVQPPNGRNDEPAADMWLNAQGELHRDYDLPAGVHEDGSLEWYQHGELHRTEDQPAYISANGTREWYRHGQLHRDGGQPAVIFDDGSCEWWEAGEQLDTSREYEDPYEGAR